MAEVKFYLEKRKDKKTGELIISNVPIFLYFSFHGQRLQYYTNMRVNANQWDDISMKVKKNYSDAAKFNQELTRLKAKVEELNDKAKALGEMPTLEYFRDRLNERLVDLVDRKTIWEGYNAYIKHLGISRAKKTVANAQTTLNTLEAFSKSRRYKLSFENINQDFYDEFLDYCYHERDFYNHYVGTHIKQIKSFLGWAKKKGYHKTVGYKSDDFKNVSEETEIIYLHYKEVIHLLNFKFENKVYDEVRDMYCLSCFTGMRHSDIVSLRPENIQGDFIINRPIKTKASNIIPLNPHSKKILKKNQGKHLDHCMPQYRVSDASGYLKEIMKLSELNRSVQIIHFKGSNRFEDMQPLWQCATFHTSKKTFLTNFLERGGSLTTGMAITGNKSYNSARRYFKIADTLRATEMAKVFGSVSSVKKKAK